MKPRRFYIGLGASFHDPAIAIVGPDGEVLFAEATERYLQNKRAMDCPADPMFRARKLVSEYCDRGSELVVAISFSESLLKRTLEYVTLDAHLPRAASELGWRYWARRTEHTAWPYPTARTMTLSQLGSWVRAGFGIVENRGIDHRATIRRYDHHLTHAAYAAYASPFTEAAVAVVDGYGEMRSSAFYHYRDGALRQLDERPGMHRVDTASLGLFYAKLCAVCGFEPMAGEEWKVMGLAAYGRYWAEAHEHMRTMLRVDGLRIVEDGGDAERGERLEKFKRFAPPPGSDPIAAADLAFTGQLFFGEILDALLTNLANATGSPRLALGGGCALNSAHTGKLTQTTPFTDVYVPSAPADDGNAIGAAWVAFHEDHPTHRFGHRTLSPYLGSVMDEDALARLARFGGLVHSHRARGDVEAITARHLAEGRIVGWVQGRAEFGPRALGNRSILADPRPATMKDEINARVKFREEFRPFAPAILAEHGSEYFEHYQHTPYMERALVFKEAVRTKVPAVVHADGTGRLQSVHRELNPRFHRLIEAFYAITGVPIVLNTSFNIMGKPIIHTVEDAIAMFMTSGLDVLVIDDWVVEKQRDVRVQVSSSAAE